MRKLTTILAATALAATALAGCGASSDDWSAEKKRAAAASDVQPSTPDTTEPTPMPSPDGTFTGSCDYTLPDSIDGEYTLIGDIEATNTGNVGIKVKVTIKWPQMGYDPVTESEKVKVPYGQSKTVRFHHVVDTETLSRVQSWETHHDYSYKCEYNGAMVDTFGDPRG